MFQNRCLFSLFWLVILSLTFSAIAVAAPQTFDRAKIELRQHVYHDQTQVGTFYCGCHWRWVGRSGGRTDLDSCHYTIRAQPVRAERTEWEHVVPASNFGRARQCWQDGGRRKCNATDPVFNAMEADMHNLTVSVGEVNADRSNYNFGMLPNTSLQHGACPIKIDFQQRTAEPRDEVKGQVARIYFYMHDRYDMRMSNQQQRLFMSWHSQYPVTDWERERDRRIAAIMGYSNPFVTGERVWRLGHQNSAEGVRSTLSPIASQVASSVSDQQPIIGNTNSKVYHLPVGCPSYERVSPHNTRHFANEQEAISAGFRKAGNCR